MAWKNRSDGYAVPRIKTLRMALPLLLVACGTGERLYGPVYPGASSPFAAPAEQPPLDLTGAGKPAYRLLLIGDGGAPQPNDPTLAALGHWGNRYPEQTTVLFLGDNVYPDGLRQSEPARGERILLQQMRATRAAKIFVPGNHDWGFSTLARLQRGRLLAQQRFVEAHAREKAEFLPVNGCPGPVVKTLVPPGDQLARGLVVVVVDFHWWLLPAEDRPSCPGVADTKAFVAELDRVLAAHRAENVVVAAHHPLRSGGTHGGLTRGFWSDLGAWTYYWLSGPIQDVWEPTYAEMIGVVSEALSRNPPVAFVAGHDHSLQVIDGGDAARLFIVSGAASAARITGVAAIDGTLFAHSHTGFIALDFVRDRPDGDALIVQVVETGVPEPVYRLALSLVDDSAEPETTALQGEPNSSPESKVLPHGGG